MNIRHTIIYTFTVSASELTEILKALQASPHKDAQDLAVELKKNVDRSRKEVQRRFSSMDSVHYKEEE